MRVTFVDFASFVIMAMLVAGVFVAPYIVALNWMYSPANRPAYSPAPNNIAPVNAGASVEPDMRQLADAAAHLCGIDEDLFWSLILRESSGRHWDADGRVLRSRSNALGLGQIKATTARDVSAHLDPMDPWDNAVASACYLRQMLDRYQGDIRRALHAYHRGPNARGATPQASHDYASDIMGSAQ